MSARCPGLRSAVGATRGPGVVSHLARRPGGTTRAGRGRGVVSCALRQRAGTARAVCGRVPISRQVRRPGPAGSDRGSVTAELAVGLPALVMLLLAALTAVGAVVTKLECVDAAREAALAAARGEPGVPAARRVAPDGATVVVTVRGDTVHASVSSRVRPLGPYLPGVEVTAAAIAQREPGLTP